MSRIQIWCKHCKKKHEVERTSEIPDNAKRVECNFCPDCMDEMDDYYKEEIIFIN